MYIRISILKIIPSVLSYRDPEDTEKYFDDDAMWEKAQSMLKEAMDELVLIIMKQKVKRHSTVRSWMYK